jgi:heat shock protein HtpX
MIGTLAVIIGLSTLFFTVILTLIGTLDFMLIGILVVTFNILQWLFSPYIIDAVYRVKEIKKADNPKLYGMVERLSIKSDIRMPKVMLARIPVPNAFAYGSPVAGTRVAVTTGLLETLEDEEVEAVIGHELGHLKHRDVQVMMFVSILPAILFYIGYSLMLSSMFSRSRREEGGSAGLLVGIIAMLLAWFLNLFILYLSRIREYYADRHSVSIVDDGARKLSEGLAKIVHTSGRMKRFRKETTNFNALKALFIADPDRAEVDAAAIARLSGDQRLVQELLRRKVTFLDRLSEIFSTHPNIIKRLKALQQLA